MIEDGEILYSLRNKSNKNFEVYNKCDAGGIHQQTQNSLFQARKLSAVLIQSRQKSHIEFFRFAFVEIFEKRFGTDQNFALAVVNSMKLARFGLRFEVADFQFAKIGGFFERHQIDGLFTTQTKCAASRTRKVSRIETRIIGGFVILSFLFSLRDLKRLRFADHFLP